jgi:hypothetical protein
VRNGHTRCFPLTASVEFNVDGGEDSKVSLADCISLLLGHKTAGCSFRNHNLLTGLHPTRSLEQSLSLLPHIDPPKATSDATSDERRMLYILNWIAYFFVKIPVGDNPSLLKVINHPLSCCESWST